VPDSPKPPPHRITLTRAALETATRTVLLVSGESKRGALERLRAGDSRLPAHGLAEMTIVTDLEIAPKSASNGCGGGCS
jgi:6-phosphogluconolactonase/glucosamine-6-phosphate isomerase/deaminase